MPRLSALHQAVAQGDLEAVRKLLTEGADVNAVADWRPTLINATPLHIAACLGHCEIALLLLQHGANPNANQQRYSKTVNFLFLTQQLFLSPLWLISCFFLLWLYSHLVLRGITDPTVRIILSLGSWLSLGTLLGVECLGKIPSHIICQLLDPLPPTPPPLTPLHLALEYGQDNMVELLVNHGANINQLGHNTRYETVTPLFIAVKKGNFNLVKLLLERDASPNSMRNDRSQLGSLARRFINNSTRYNLENIIFQFILPGNFVGTEFKFYVLLERYFFPRTPLHEAVHQGHEDIVRLLLEYGADFHAICLEKVLRTTECFKMTPLHYAFYNLLNETDQALKHRKTEIAKLLFKRMTNPSTSSLNELLHLATESCVSTNIELLIKQGANINSRLEQNGLTPLHRVFMTRLFPSNPSSTNAFYYRDPMPQGNHDNKDVAAERLTTLRLLLSSGADVNAVVSKKIFCTPLSLAIKTHWLEAVEALLESGATLSWKEGWFKIQSSIVTIVEIYNLHANFLQAEREQAKSILIKMLQRVFKNTNYKLIMKDIMKDTKLSSLLEQAKERKETELTKFLYPFEICRNLGEENLLQARVKNAFEYLIQHGRIRTYHYNYIFQCKHALVQDYLEIFGNQLLEIIEEESENVPTLKALVMDYILQNPEFFSKKDLEKLTHDLKSELKEANTSMPILTLCYPITSQSSWQELRAKHRQRQQNNLYDEPISTNDNPEIEIKIKVL